MSAFKALMNLYDASKDSGSKQIDAPFQPEDAGINWLPPGQSAAGNNGILWNNPQNPNLTTALSDSLYDDYGPKTGQYNNGNLTTALSDSLYDDYAMPQNPSFQDKSPLAQFGDLVQEAHSPGYIKGNERSAANPHDNGIIWNAPDPNASIPDPYQVPHMATQTPFRDTTFGQILGATKIGNRIFEAQRNAERNTALTNFAQNMPSDPIAQIQGMVKIDPEHAPEYIGALMRYQQEQNNPVRKAQLEEIQQKAEHRRAIAAYAAMVGGDNNATSHAAPSDDMQSIIDDATGQTQDPMQEFHDAQAHQQSITGVSPAQNADDSTNIAPDSTATAPVTATRTSTASPYQQAALAAFKADPTDETQKMYIESLKAGADNQTSEIKNYEYQKTHPDFITSKTASGQMSSFAPESPFQKAQAQGVTGDALIDTVPDKNVQNKAKALLRGDAPYPVLSSRTPVEVKAALEVAQAADPNYSATTAPVRKKNAEYFAPSGEGGKLLTSVKVIAKHINTMSDAQKKLNNSGLLPGATLENYVVNNLSRSYDNPTHSALNSFQEASNNVAPELAKVVSGKTNVPEDDVKEQRKVFSAYDGNDAFEASSHTAAEMVAARAQAMLDNYRQSTGSNGKPPAPSMDKDTIETFKKLGVNLDDYFDIGADKKEVNYQIVDGKLVPQ